MILGNVLKVVLDYINSSNKKDLAPLERKKNAVTIAKQNTAQYKNIETNLFSLNSDTQKLVKKIDSLQDQIINLTMLNEELLHMFEQNIENQISKSQEEQAPMRQVSFAAKKNELN